MKRFLFSIIAVIFLGPAVFSLGEEIIPIGAAASWAAMETRSGLTEAGMARPRPVLTLAAKDVPKKSDLYLSFDQSAPGAFGDAEDNWEVTVSEAVKSAARPWPRKGEGAASFSGRPGTNPLELKPLSSAVFSPGRMAGDFSIEFWLNPLTLENGAQILSWSASPSQRILSTISQSAVKWSFSNFFVEPGGGDSGAISADLAFSSPPLLPGQWSHHKVSFDIQTGAVEYRVNGKCEALLYATGTGHEAGEVWPPLIGEDGFFVLGGHFTGLLDEFRVTGAGAEKNGGLLKAALRRYAGPGRAESKPLDLGGPGSRVLKIEAAGGETRQGGAQNFYAGRLTGTPRFDDNAQIQFFARTSDNPYRFGNWTPIEAGADLDARFTGRYLQVAADFYPSGDGESAPYLDEIRITYKRAEAPLPPAYIAAIARDGAVELSWRPSVSEDLGGYLVYIGTSPGRYVTASSEAAPAPAPLDAGNRTAVKIDGLKNGVLYYFAVASYGKRDPYTGGTVIGDFSKEAAARPLKQSLVAVSLD